MQNGTLLYGNLFPPLYRYQHSNEPLTELLAESLLVLRGGGGCRGGGGETLLSVCLSETKNHSFFNKALITMKLCQNTSKCICNRNLYIDFSKNYFFARKV